MDVSDTAVLREAFMQLNTRLSQQESQIQTLTSENQTLTTRLATSTPTNPPRTASPRGVSTSSLVDTRLLGKPEGFTGDPQKYPDWSFKLKPYLGAIDVRYQAMISLVEQSTQPILNVGLSADEAQLSTPL